VVGAVGPQVERPEDAFEIRLNRGEALDAKGDSL
jgi:hypothetical protein